MLFSNRSLTDIFTSSYNEDLITNGFPWFFSFLGYLKLYFISEILQKRLILMHPFYEVISFQRILHKGFEPDRCLCLLKHKLQDLWLWLLSSFLDLRGLFLIRLNFDNKALIDWIFLQILLPNLFCVGLEARVGC